MGRAVHPIPQEGPALTDGGPDDVELRKELARVSIRALFHRPGTPWKGDVVRRPESDYRQQSEILIFRCPNEACRHWLRKPTPGERVRCRVCSCTAVYLDVLAAEALAEHRAGRSKPITDSDF